ncbi:MAG TPA: DUF3572 domain-containing protein [Rhizomicrobium sp.]|jgi:hypothetical protein|nr:DUF3572 domain-containing protein [Rhizomicrobium sp.]
MAVRTSTPDAETLALKALTFLANSPDDLARFLNLSGIAPADLRARAGDRDVLVGTLDFLLTHEPLLSRFCVSETIDAKAVHLARVGLSSPAVRAN